MLAAKVLNGTGWVMTLLFGVEFAMAQSPNRMRGIMMGLVIIVSAARSLTCRDDLDSKWRLLLAENELSRVSLLSSISIGN